MKKQITLDHGSGGTASDELVRSIFLKHLRSPLLQKLDDAALITLPDPFSRRLAFSTDSYVVDPLFFPGGSIGELAVNGTINDLSMQGAMPLALSLAFILEEGLSMHELERVVSDVAAACSRAEVPVITGDTKVVQRGKADRVFINTSGIGVVEHEIDISPSRIRPGDAVVVSGTIGDHGITVLTSREGLELQGNVRSDTCALHKMVQGIISRLNGLDCPDALHAMRDPTRGGLATSLSEMARAAGVCMEIYEGQIPMHGEVRAACEIMGLDPLYLANEGKCIVVVENKVADAVIDAMYSFPEGKESAIIGEVTDAHAGRVVVHTVSGGSRLAEPLAGEALPRIC